MAGEVRGRVKGVVGGGQTGYGERKRRSRRREAAEVMRGVRQVVFWRKCGRVVADVVKTAVRRRMMMVTDDWLAVVRWGRDSVVQ